MLVTLRRAARSILPDARISIRPRAGAYHLGLSDGTSLLIWKDGGRVLRAPDAGLAQRLMLAIARGLQREKSETAPDQETLPERAQIPLPQSRRDTPARSVTDPTATSSAITTERLLFLDEGVVGKPGASSALKSWAGPAARLLRLERLADGDFIDQIARSVRAQKVEGCWIITSDAEDIPARTTTLWSELTTYHRDLGAVFRIAALDDHGSLREICMPAGKAAEPDDVDADPDPGPDPPAPDF